jgi:prepilin-type N-terminal cleavage/methylation domain-containing protein
MFFRLKEVSGFTLLETLLVVAIVGLLSVITFGFAASGAEIYRIVSDGQRVNSDLMVAVERITRELQHAAVITEAGGARLSFADPKKASCNNCVDKSTFITYRWVEGTPASPQLKLYREGNLSGERLIADNITAFEVSQLPVNELVTIRITKTVGDSSVTLTTSVHPDPNVEEVIQ